MANPEQLRIVKQGVEVWNEWRMLNANVMPDLRESDLSNAILVGGYFTETDFSGANLSCAKLIRSQLHLGTLYGADIRGADLSGANLAGANLSCADLSATHLGGADMQGTNLSEAKLIEAHLMRANLRGADLRGADLTKSYLAWTNFHNADMNGADLTQAQLWGSVFGDNDLSFVRGLESVKHLGPSIVGTETLARSKGKIPDSFLRGVGVRDDFIEFMRSWRVKALEYYSCFISYSTKDQEFADRLYADLQGKGVRCWFAPEDMKIGDKIRDRIDESIRVRDKLLLILSKTSVASPRVEQEVETALEEERKRGKTVLFPVRLDDTVFSVDMGWPNLLKNSRHIGDFTDWKNHDSYQKAFDRLLRDLKAG